MKTTMKRMAIFGLMFLGASRVSAAPADIMAKVMATGIPGLKLGVGNPVQTPPVQTPPLRQARVTYKVFHQLVVKNGNEYDIQKTKVCEVTTTANVYDFRGAAGGGIDFNDGQSCVASYQGMPAEVHFGSVVALTEAGGDMGYGTGDIKTVWSLAYVKYSGVHLGPEVEIPQGMAATRDLNQRSFLLQMTPQISISCSAPGLCRISNPETFAVFVDIED